MEKPAIRLPPIPLKVSPWGEDLLRLVPERMRTIALKHMNGGMSLSNQEWPKAGATRKETNGEAWGVWVGVMNALEIAFGCCSLDPAKPFVASVETTHFIAQLKSMDNLMDLFHDAETLWENWEHET